MNKIGICFPASDYLNMGIEGSKKYLQKFIELGIYSFDMFTSLIIKSDEKIYDLLSFLNDNNVKITFHYHSDNVVDNLLTDQNVEILTNQYKDDLTKLRNKLKRANIDYNITIVFHALDYDEEHQKSLHQKNLCSIFSELSDFAKLLQFTILVETLSHTHPKGNHIGDDMYELESLVNQIDNPNFGICWDIGHTRANSLEHYGELYLSDKLISKVKFTHIHNIYIDNNKITMDHLPLTNLELQDDEIRYLKKHNYDGIYSIEMAIENLKENIDVYLHSIDLLKEILEKYEED